MVHNLLGVLSGVVIGFVFTPIMVYTMGRLLGWYTFPFLWWMKEDKEVRNVQLVFIALSIPSAIYLAFWY